MMDGWVMASHKSITYYHTIAPLPLQKVVQVIDQISLLLVGLMGGSRKMHGSFRLAMYRRITFSCIYFQLFLCKSDTWKKHLTLASFTYKYTTNHHQHQFLLDKQI